MTHDEFQQLRTWFERLVALSDPERAAAILQISEQHPNLAAELKRMLAAQSDGPSLVDTPAAELIAGHLMDPPQPEPEHEGAIFGAYRLEKELGRGGMGVVYLASRADGSFQKQVAIKILRHDRVDRHFLRRFQQEREILAQLNHPHIAAIIDAGTTTAGDPYFVMEYVDGVPITTYCNSHHLSVDQKLSLFLQVCDAVQYAHRNLTVHRDLKPGNILVTQAGAVKLLDFGIAKILQQSPDREAEITGILTPEYTSPEQIRNEPITTSADVFSLGILLYELLGGEHPFRSKERLPHEVMRAICEYNPAPLSTVAHHDAKRLRGDLDTIVRTALRKQPVWRYPSVEQLADDLERHRRGFPVLAKGDRLSYRLRKFARRHWIPVTAVALIIMSLSAGIIATTRQTRLAEQARAAAEFARGDEARERIAADHQRLLAEAAQRTATEQRSLAEARTKEAESERQKEQARYREVRALAASLLFDLHDGIRDLAGSTTARRLIVGKAQRQLEVLSADSGNDIDLQRDLAASYERMGELRVDRRQPNKNDAGAALEAYKHAVELRRKIANRRTAPARDQRDLALSLAKLGDGQFMASQVKEARESYDDALRLVRNLVQAQPQDESMKRALGAIDERRCIVLLTAGNDASALESCREGITTLTPLAAAAPDNIEIQRLIATTQASYANALRISGKSREAEVQAKLAVESLQRLETLAPNNAEYRRLSSSSESILASSLAASGDLEGSLAAFRRSVRAMEVALEIDPSDLGSCLRLAVTLRGLSRRLLAAGKNDAAHDASRESLRLLNQAAKTPGSGAVEWNEYADALLKVQWPDLLDAAKALELAEKSVASTKRTNPFFLDTLAWAYFRSGSAGKAADTEREALHLLPPNAKGGLHDELDQGLKTFLGSNNAR